jgi:enamine deaminase RidA (YjgF/YER057c/UK114 family)
MFSPVMEKIGLMGGAAFGAAAPDAPALDAPLIHVPLAVLEGEPFDLWHAAGPQMDASLGHVKARRSDNLCFGIVPVGEGPLETAAREAYLALFAYVSVSPCPHLLRIWNYLPRITAPDETGTERYRRFNTGRHEAFVEARSDVGIPPAASALGTHIGQPCLYFLSAATPGIAIENPRQVSAYRYPEQYGPRSPTFSRSLLAPWDGGQVFLISGTASIVGHETVHTGDVAAQTAETILNLQTLLGEAAKHGFTSARAEGRLKIYVRHPADLPVIRALVEEAFPNAQRLYLNADVCRPELLVEIEAAFMDTP